MDLDIFKYKNIFPADVSEAASFFLRVMALLPPIHKTAARMILKPLMCDELVVPTLRGLEDGGYIWHRETQQGDFYAITAKTAAYLDIHHEIKKHRTQEIKDKTLLTNRLKTYAAGSALVCAGSAAYKDAWDALPQSEKDAYLESKSVLPEIFEARLANLNTATVDLLPRSIVSVAAVCDRMGNAIKEGKIPFTPPYNKTIYRNTADSILKCSHIYDVGKVYIARLASMTLNEQLSKKLTTAREQTEAAQMMAGVYTYSHGVKVLSLAVLEANGIFIERMDEDAVLFGILNNAAHGMYPETVEARLDYCVSLAEHLSRTPAVHIYTTPEDRPITERRVGRAIAKAPFAAPSVSWTEVSANRPLQRWQVWKALS